MHAKLLLLLLAMANSAEASTPNKAHSYLATPKVNLEVITALPKKILAGHHAEMEIKVTNNADQLNDDADAHNQTLSISSIKDQTVKLNKAQLNLYFAQSKEIGAKHACWNGIKGATLKPGESCYQIISVTGPNKSFIDGKIYVYAQSISGQKTHTTMDIKTGFYPSKKLM